MYTGYTADLNGTKIMNKRLAQMGEEFGLLGVYYTANDEGSCQGLNSTVIREECWKRVEKPSYKWYTNSPKNGYNNTVSCEHQACKHGATRTSMEEYWRDIDAGPALYTQNVWYGYGCRKRTINQVTTSSELASRGNCPEGEKVLNGKTVSIEPFAVISLAAALGPRPAMLALILSLANMAQAHNVWAVREVVDPNQKQWESMMATVAEVSEGRLNQSVKSCCESSEVLFPDCYIMREVRKRHKEKFDKFYEDLTLKTNCDERLRVLWACVDRPTLCEIFKKEMVDSNIPYNKMKEVLIIFDEDGYDVAMRMARTEAKQLVHDNRQVMTNTADAHRRACSQMLVPWEAIDDKPEGPRYAASRHDGD